VSVSEETEQQTHQITKLYRSAADNAWRMWMWMWMWMWRSTHIFDVARITFVSIDVNLHPIFEVEFLHEHPILVWNRHVPHDHILRNDYCVLL
jgi:hypothetical protein